MRKEGDLVKACLLYLKAKGMMAWRNNSGAWKTGTRYIKFGVLGSGDVFAILEGGRFMSIEAKVGTNKPTEAQIQWAREVEAHGGIARVVYSVDDLEHYLKEVWIR